MTDAESSSRPIVLCPLRYEREQLQRSGLEAHVELVQTGPGADAIVHWAEACGETRRLVILAGLAGSLRPTFAPGTAAVIATVIDDLGRSFTSALWGEASWPLPGTRVLRAVIASSTTPLGSVDERRAFAARTGADLVDQESAAFALAGSILGLRWGIVRGVSDGHDTSLPRAIDRWVDEAGATRLPRVMASLTTRPWMIPGVVRLARDSRIAMRRVADVIHALLDPRPNPGPVHSAATP